MINLLCLVPLTQNVRSPRDGIEPSLLRSERRVLPLNDLGSKSTIYLVRRNGSEGWGRTTVPTFKVSCPAIRRLRIMLALEIVFRYSGIPAIPKSGARQWIRTTNFLLLRQASLPVGLLGHGADLVLVGLKICRT